MTTHYLTIWTKMQGNRGLAVCNRYVDYATDSDQPTCEDCRRLIAEEDVWPPMPIVDVSLEEYKAQWYSPHRDGSGGERCMVHSPACIRCISCLQWIRPDDMNLTCQSSVRRAVPTPH